MDPGVLFKIPDTPSFPLPPTPTGQLTLLPSPTLLFQAGEKAEREFVNAKVVPDPSER